MKNRVGECFTTTMGYDLKIVEYFGATDCTVEFKDGTVRHNIAYNSLKIGRVAHPNHYKNEELGKKYTTNEGYNIEIIDYFSRHNCHIQFDDEVKTVLENVRLEHIKSGSVKNPNKVFLFGKGFIGQGSYKSKGDTYSLKVYNSWAKMFSRCYNEKERLKHPTYKGIEVCEEWYNFQNFAKWFEDNWKAWMNSKWCLDKDILIKGNKIYSPETCCIIPQEINVLFRNFKVREGLPTGVSQRGKRFTAYFGKNLKHISTFDSVVEAFQAYKIVKETHIKEKADEWKDRVDSKVYEAMYNWIVEITD